MEKAVSFKNQTNNALHGILHIPDNGLQKRTGVNLLNPGLKNRVAPNRLNVKIARTLCEQGFYVLRSDPHGIGDSEGSLPNEPLLDLWGIIQKGLFVDDTIKANEYFVDTCSLQKLILIGGCGGAITAFLTAVNDRTVDRLIFIDLPVIISTSRRSYSDRIISSRITAQHAQQAYFKKAFNPASWINFFKGKSDYAAIWTIVKKKLGLPSFMTQRKTYDELNFNKSIPSGLKKLISRGVKMSFLLADNDTNTQIFKDQFQTPYLSHHSKKSDLFDVFTIKNANHIYTLVESQNTLINYICKTLDASDAKHGKKN